MLRQQARYLRDLHGGAQPLVLPNAWDAASARAVAGAGFPVVATTSGGVAASLGWPDGEQVPPAEMFDAVARIAGAVAVPVTADIEAGYGLPADELVAALLAAGAVGCNLEDTDHSHGNVLVDPVSQAERIAGIKDAARTAGVDIVVNARIDVFVREAGSRDERVEQTVARAAPYLDAGADCIYPIGADEEALATLVARIPAPLNGMVRPGLTRFTRLRQLSMARISFASALHRLVMAGLGARLETIARGGDDWHDG